VLARQRRIPWRRLFVKEYLFIRRHGSRGLRGSPVTREATFAASRLCLFTSPFVRGALLVRGSAALAGNLSLFISIHRRKAAIFGSHVGTLSPVSATAAPDKFF
jgi:hypothetical protein